MSLCEQSRRECKRLDMYISKNMHAFLKREALRRREGEQQMTIVVRDLIRTAMLREKREG